jgi:RNA polymerase sigma-70 factor (ECF subfamily)
MRLTGLRAKKSFSTSARQVSYNTGSPWIPLPATEAEIRTLYERYAHILHYRARSILGSDEEAADAVQETFARVIRNYDDFRMEASPLTWMYRISTNWCLNRLRDRKGHDRKHVENKEEIIGDGLSPAPGEAFEREELRQLIREADEETQKILIHLYFDDMTREDTAVVVGISVPTLRKRLEAFFKKAKWSLGGGG